MSKNDEFMHTEIVEDKTKGTYEFRATINQDQLNNLCEFTELKIIDKIADKLSEDLAYKVNDEIDWSKITDKIQNAIIKNYSIKLLRDTLQERGKIE